MRSRITNRVLAAILSVILMLQMGMPAVHAEGSTPGQKAKTITAFGELADDEKNITVTMGTPEAELPLPETVTAAVYGETSAQVDIAVVWESDKPFSTEKADTYIYTAGLSDENSQVYTLAEGVEMPEATVTVTADTPGILPAAIIRASAADPTPVTELWVGSTQVVQSGGTVTADTSGPGWSFDSATATLTLNGANITTTNKPDIANDPGSGYWSYGIYCYGDLNIVVTGDSTIDVKAAAGRSCGILVKGDLSVSGSAELTVAGNWRGVFVTENLILSEAVSLSSVAGGTTNSGLIGVIVNNSIMVSDSASLYGRALPQIGTSGVSCIKGNITVGNGATLTAIADDGYSGEGDGRNCGLIAGSLELSGVSGNVRVSGTLVASAGDAVNRGIANGLWLYNTNLVVSGNGSIHAESGEPGFGGSTSYGVDVKGSGSIEVNAGGFLALGGTCAVNPATTTVTISGTPVFYEVSANRDGSSATVCTDTDTWNSTYNGNFGAYKYINATTVYEVYINGTQVTRVNRNDVLDDGTVSYTPAAGENPARLTLDGASLTSVRLDGDTELALTGANTVGTIENAGAVTVSGGELTVTGSFDCGSESLTVESGAMLTTRGTVEAGTVVNGGTLVNEGTLMLPEATTVEQIQGMNLTGDGIVKAGARIYLGGKLYADGGDASSDGLDLSTLPTEGTYYKTGSGYAIFNPATADPATNAWLELHGTVISTTNATALVLPSTEPVDIIVAGDSSLTAGGSGNVINTNGQSLSVTGSGDLTLAGPYYGINVNGSGAVSIVIEGKLTFDTGSQPISTGGDITVSAKNITTIKGYNFYSGGAVSFTATEGDISLTTKDSYSGAVYGNSITLTANRGAVTIHHSDNAQGGYALNATAVAVSALNDVTITTSRGGICASSGAVSVTSQSGSIKMDCAMEQCVSASGTVTLNAAEDITLNDSADHSTAISAYGQAVDITAGDKLSSTSDYGLQTGALTIQANEVSIEGNRQDGIQASSVAITNTDGTGNCERVSITATSSSDERAAIYSYGNITVKAERLFVFGKNSAKAIHATGTVTIGDTGFIIGDMDISDTSGIDSRIICAANGGEISTGGLALDINTPTATTYYQAGDGYVLFNPASGETPATLVLHNADINSSNSVSLKLGADTVIQLEGANRLTNTYTGGNGVGINASEKAVTIQGGSGDSLSISAWQCVSWVSNLTISGGNVDMNGSSYGIAIDGDVSLQNGAQVSLTGGTGGGALNIGDEMSEIVTPRHLTVNGGSSLTTHGNTYITGDLTIGSESTVTIQEGDKFWVPMAASITNNGTIINNGTFILPYSYTAAQVQALNIPGTVKLFNTGNGKYKVYVDGEFYADGGKLTTALNLSEPPEETTYYEVISGFCYIIFTPASGDTTATLTLHDINNVGYLSDGITLPDAPITLHLEGENYFYQINASNSISISGNGLLNSNINNSNTSAVLTVGTEAILNAVYRTTASGVTTYTIYGSYSDNFTVGPNSKLVLTPGAVLELTEYCKLVFFQNSTLADMTIGAGASIVNNGFITLPLGTTVAQITALPLSGVGVVRVTTEYNDGSPSAWDTYTNDGIVVTVISGGLDLTIGDHSGATLENAGYAWDSTTNTLSLGSACVTGNLTLPCNTRVTISTASSSIISGDIRAASDSSGYDYPIELTFTGTGPLAINGGISGAINNDTVTVQGGAQVTMNGSVFLGGSGGADGTLNVSGTGTILNITSRYGYGVMCDTVNIGSGASLNVNSGSVGVEALSGVNITGGSTLTAGCDYGVYIIGGKLTVDSNSKLVTNGAVAPFCVVDTTSSKAQSDTVSLPGIPGGTAIASVTGTNRGFNYWSLVPTGGSLGVSNEYNDIATLSGAKTGTLTFVKPAGTGGSDDSSDSRPVSRNDSVSYTLTFETNGGSAINKLVKVSGTTVSLSAYIPTRDGYEFAGWYSDAALTTKVTSITLTKNTTVYAKWTPKSAQSKNPFTDVSDSDYYHNAVLWAVKKGITSGTTGTTFSPDMICTRAQAVTFFWRAEGSPEPMPANCPFTDVPKDAYYYKAVLWAIEKGITKGTSVTTFSPNDTVTRCQSMTFLWRAAGEVASASANPFTDVVSDTYYYNAVLWSVEKCITKGTTATSFSPDAGCTRAQIVTFLYRYMGE